MASGSTGLLRTFLIARHGETDCNKAGIFQGSMLHPEPKLLPEGEAQVSALGCFLASKRRQIDRVCVSYLHRTIASMECVRRSYASYQCDNYPEDGKRLQMPESEIFEDLREVDLYTWQGKTREEVQRFYPQEYKMWLVNPCQVKIDGHAIWPEMMVRLKGMWEVLRQGTSTTTFVMAHGGVNRGLLLTAMGWPMERIKDIKYTFGNASLVELEWYEGEPCARRWRQVYPSVQDWRLATEGSLVHE
eukprot:gnl/MRDRNA2_/MRDRNA2_126907_c0_seq1.p1 gnl/MRDRNA2_/MRDRNA2_126907_c0~~gnl/MRDRNA2_/MRDRNA2_126907_c0_seq1.p1  ORF type:complete len:265 (+),score=33.33 gnl/MRDRNA2_/MRDRNA2_126907_c0_seq1:59-796(+)